MLSKILSFENVIHKKLKRLSIYRVWGVVLVHCDTTLEKLKCIVKMMSPVGAREPLTELNLSIIRMGVSELRIYCYLGE